VTARSPFAELLARLGREGERVRLVYIRGDRVDNHMVDGEHIQRLDEIVAAHTEAEQNVYFEINPSSFWPGEAADFEERKRSSSRHITRLSSLYIDIDYKDGGLGSPQAAQQLIQDLTAALGVPPAAVVHSGGGMQPYWPIADGEITPESRERVATIAARWKALVDSFAAALGGKVDSLFDLPRIFRVPGSMNYKYDPPAAVHADYLDGWEPFTLDELEELFTEYGIDAQPRQISDVPLSTMEQWDWAPHDCQFAATFRAELLTQPVTARHPWMLAKVAQLHGMLRYGCVTEETFYELRTLIDVRHRELCRTQEPIRDPQPGEYLGALRWGETQASLWTNDQLAVEMRSHVHADFMAMFAGTAQNQPQPPPTPQPEKPVISLFTKQPVTAFGTTTVAQPIQGALALSPQSQQRLLASAHTDSGNAELFAQSIAGRFIHVSDVGWHMWDGARWVEDNGNRVREALKDLFTQRLVSETDVDEVAWLRQSLNAARMSATLKWAESVPSVQVYPHELDQNHYDLVTPGGIVDLRTAQLRPANPLVDRNSKITGVAPDFSGPPERWLGLLNWQFGHVEGMVEYIQRLFGIALIGERRARIFPIFLGSGANGKSVLAEVSLGVFGNYAIKLGSRFFIESKSEQHPEQVAALRGVRWAIGSEVPATARFNEQLVKELTGDRTIRARRMRENSYDFYNSVTLALVANHLPSVGTGGPAWWGRVRRIDMNKVMPEDKQVEGLESILLATEGGKILAWMIEGALKYLTEGEKPPQAVIEATARYRAEEDALARFTDSRLVFDANLTTPRQAIYNDYQMWANMNRIFPVLSEPKFVREFLTIYPNARVGDDEQYFFGVRLAGTPVREAPYDPLAAVLGV
jgi:P4 family phage/plasmid primase-like protien